MVNESRDAAQTVSVMRHGRGRRGSFGLVLVLVIEGSTQGQASPDQIEQDAGMEARWWTVDEIRATGELVEPPRLYEIVEAQARPAPVPQREAAPAGLASAGVSVPEGSCIGNGKSGLSGAARTMTVRGG
jgi:hypothetical protein